MDVMDAILTRRSIRRFEKGEVTDEQLHKILEAGMNAPSAGNEQPWHFIVVRDKKVLAEIPKFSPYASMAPEASVAILVCGDPKLEKHKGFWIQDCSAAIQNILLAVHALGLGAVWTGGYPLEGRAEGFRKLLGIPEGIVPLALIPIGKPAQKGGKANRYREERVHREKW